MMQILLTALVLATAPMAWGDAAPYCPWQTNYTAEPTPKESKQCLRRMRWFDRHYCRKYPGAGLCVAQVTFASCYTAYIPSGLDCQTGHYVCSGMPAAANLPENYRCYMGGGDVLEVIPARTDVLPVPPPPCGATFPPIQPKVRELRRCATKLDWFRTHLCANPENSGLPPCVLQVWTSSCLPYSPSDADCVAGAYRCAARPDGSCDLS